MVSYASTNALSMLGGDDYDTIQEEIAVLDASVVHKTGNLNESINGVKTFTSDFNVNTGGSSKLSITSTDTTMNNFSHLMNSTADITLQIGGVPALYLDANNTQLVGDNILLEGTSPIIGSLLTTPISFTTNSVEKLNIQTNETTITNPNVFIVDDSTGLTNVKFSDEEVIIKAPNGGSTFDIQGSLMRIDGSNPGGLNQLFFGAVNPFSSIEFRNTSMLFLNTDIVITTDSTNTSGKQMGISALSTTTGDLNFLLYKRTSSVNFTGTGWRWVRQNSGGDLLFQRRSTSSGGISTNTTIQSIDSGGTTETFTCATQTKVASTAFKVQTVAGTDKLNITPTAIELVNDEIIASANTGDIAFLMGPTGSLVVQNNTVDKLNISSSVTNITNASINAIGNLYADRYLLGRSTGSNRPLSSMVLGCGVNEVSLPNVASGATVTTDGFWASGGRVIRTPSYGLFYPQFITIQLSGGFTGGTSPTIRVEVINGSTSPDSIIASTGNIGYTSTMSIFPTAASHSFTTVNALGDGIQYYVRYVIINGTGTAISASTKKAFVQVYGYQTNN